MRVVLVFLLVVWLLWLPVFIFWRYAGERMFKAAPALIGGYCSLVLCGFMVATGQWITAAVAAPIAMLLVIFALRSSHRGDESTHEKNKEE